MIAKEKLDFWLANNYNVLFVGKHGVGKTTIVLDAFERRGLKWLYYSASTMDPWVDMIGVPKEKVDPKTGQSVLELVRPKEFQNDEVEAIFFDEFNRSHKKIRNAVMELIQFKSINGKKFHNLKVVWAAINPEDEEDTYDVDRLDPAQEDRFHIKVDVPYKPSGEYFSSKYGRDTARAAMDWWTGLPDAQKAKVSPRRLDYAMDIFSRGGDLRDVLPHDANIPKLITTLANGPAGDALRKFMTNVDSTGAREWLQNENNFAACFDFFEKPKFMAFFLPLLPKEKIALLVSKNARIRDYVVAQHTAQPVFEEVLKSLIANGQNDKLVRLLRRAMPQNSPLVIGTIPGLGMKPAKARNCGLLENPSFDGMLASELTTLIDPRTQTPRRMRSVLTLVQTMPVKMSNPTASKALNLLDLVAKSSQNVTIQRMEGEFFGALNHILSIFYAQGITFAQMQADPQTYPLGHILKRVRWHTKFANRVLGS